MKSDRELIREYAHSKSEAAFSTLVNRHLNLVYSAALRQVRSPQLAEEIAQSAFTDLARNAQHLAPDTILTAWLYQVTRRTAIDVIRRETRRRLREQIAVELNNLNATANDWTQIEPLLDDALAALEETDRAAVLLRYFENKSLREVGEALGASEDAAQKRVSRAVQRLREFFSKRHVTVGAGGLAALISANAVQSAPAGLAAAISAGAVLTGTAVSTSTLIAATKTIAMTAFQKAIIGTALVAAIGTGVYEAHENSQLHSQVRTLHQQQAPLREQVRHLREEHENLTNRLASLMAANAQLQSDQNENELLKLRGEIALLRQQAATNENAAATTSENREKSVLKEPSGEETGRELGTAVVRGDSGAFDKLLAAAKAEQKNFNTQRVGLDQQQKDDLSQRTFQPINVAFQIIGDAAAKGNSPALDALARSLQIPELRGLAVGSLGGLAGNGDPGALDILIHPKKYGVLLSSTIPALRPAAANGNQAAIKALAAVADDEKNQPLWFMTAASLTPAAASGSAVAVDALIHMSSSTNRSIQRAVVSGLRSAAANQNAKAAEALRTMHLQ